MVSLVNLYKRPLDQKVLSFYHEFKNRKENTGKNIFKIISQELEEDYNISFQELVNREVYEYEKKFSLFFLGLEAYYMPKIPI